jgi:glycosyltransferase involved in cell wall biosynthesis
MTPHPQAGPGADGPTEVAVAFPAGRGVDWWRGRHDQSPVPGRWPYGLDQVSAPHVDVRAVEVPAPGRLAARLRRAGVPLPRPGWGGAHVALGWEERLVPAMLARGQDAALLAGVIWATDRVRAGHADELTPLRSALLRTDGLWCLSRTQLDVVADWLGPSAPPVSYLPFGVDTDFYDHRPLDPGAPPVVASMGGDRDRDAETLFTALTTVRAARPAVRGRVQTSSTLPAPDGVEVTAFVPHAQARDLLASATVVALATRPNEHVSGVTVALESMSTGRAVVVSDTPGMSDYVEHGVTGLLVPPQEPQALADAVLQLVDDPDEAARMGARARARVESSFSTATMCATLRELALSARR